MEKRKYNEILKEQLARMAAVADGMEEQEAAYAAGRLETMLDVRRLELAANKK